MLLDWIYTGSLPRSQKVFLDKVFDIFEVADYLTIDIILELCTKRLLEVIYFDFYSSSIYNIENFGR